jgi:hypothetical protein
MDADVVKAILLWQDAHTGGDICAYSLAAYLDRLFPRVRAEQVARCVSFCDSSERHEMEPDVKLWAHCLNAARARPARLTGWQD